MSKDGSSCYVQILTCDTQMWTTRDLDMYDSYEGWHLLLNLKNCPLYNNVGGIFYQDHKIPK